MVHKCNKIGFSAEFKWPVQLHRHRRSADILKDKNSFYIPKMVICLFVRSAKRNFHSSQMQLDMLRHAKE